tara:strand:- start:29605 stop:31680 length:2076 start_codon:yes stop_codon:yes gene_type:complete
MEAIPFAPCDETGQNLLFPAHETSGEKIENDKDWRVVPGPPFPPVDLAPCVAVDFETYYSSSYSLRKMPLWSYVENIAFDAFLVALEWFDGETYRRWVGAPSAAPWHDIGGIIWLSHNATFDELVFLRLRKLERVVTAALASTWECTADMSAFLQAGRSLERAALAILGEKLDKTVRDKMKGGNAGAEESRDYAAEDSRACMWLWQKVSNQWSAQERTLSRMTRYQGWEGIYVDDDQIAESLEILERHKAAIQKEIPWASKYPPASPKAFSLACYEVGIIPPESLAKASEDADIWHLKHGDKYPWISLVRRYTQANQITQALGVLSERRRKRDGRVPFEMKYCGSPHTKRWQSQKGLRLLNLNRGEVEGVSLRGHLLPPPGHVFAIADLSQIEPRVMHWLIGDQPFLQSCREGISPYESHARASMGYSDPRPLKKVNPLQYSLAKARVLALGYGAWADTFVTSAWSMAGLRIDRDHKTYIYGDVSLSEKQLFKALEDPLRNPEIQAAFVAGLIQELPSALSTVKDYRGSNPLVANFWNSLEDAADACEGGDFFYTSPSGAQMRYFDVEVYRWEETNERTGRVYKKRKIEAWLNKNSRNPDDHKNLYGGLLAENVVQFTAREVFASRLIEILKLPDVRVNWTVHDEGVLVIPEVVAHERAAEILDIMNEAPPWAPGLPIACEKVELSDRFKK